MLEGEPKLKFSMFYAMDGGNSLKQIQQREAAPDTTNTGGPTVGKSSKSIDTWVIEPGMYMMNAEVDKWSEEMLKAYFANYSENIDDGNPCAECWRNMKSELTDVGCFCSDRHLPGTLSSWFCAPSGGHDS